VGHRLGRELDTPRAPVWTRRPERGTGLMLLLAARLALALGRRASRWMLHPVSLYFFVFSPRERAASRGFLRRALSREATSLDVYRHFHCFASILLDRVYLISGRYACFEVQVHGQELVDELARSGKGCLLLGAHVGSFEMLRFLAQEGRGFPVKLAMYEQNARKMNAAYDAIDPARAMPIIALGKIDSMLRVEEALERGEIVGLLADRTISDKGTTRCSFLGEDARFPTGPIRLGTMLGRPMILMFCLFRGGNRYEVHFERLSDPAFRHGEHRSEALERSVQQFASRLERYCRLAPYNWFNFYDYWE
jgi:predicted LPLAT superfamily acyltransferase